MAHQEGNSPNRHRQRKRRAADSDKLLFFAIVFFAELSRDDLALGVLIIDIIRFIGGNASVGVGLGIGINAGNHRVNFYAVFIDLLVAEYGVNSHDSDNNYRNSDEYISSRIHNSFLLCRNHFDVLIF